MEGVKYPYNDPLVVTMIIENNTVKRTLIDNGSSVYVLYYTAFKEMSFNDSQLSPSQGPLYGFSGAETRIK